MRDYFWIFILGIITTVAIVVFLMTVTKSTVLIKKLKLPKIKLALNFLLLGIALTNISLIIYVFILVKDQITALT